jgi:hypothetical protein
MRLLLGCVTPDNATNAVRSGGLGLRYSAQRHKCTSASLRPDYSANIDCRSFDQTVFCQTETWLVLSLVNGSRCQPPQRSRSDSPANRAMRSSSAGHT